MMSWRISGWSLLLCLVFFSCKQETGDHLPQDKMEKVMLDIQLAEVYSTMAGYDTVTHVPLKNNDSLAKFYREVLQHHNISLDQFKQSLDWYRQHPNVLDTIYNNLMGTLTIEAAKLDNKKADTAAEKK